MEEYYFLLAIGFLWSIFASVQDFKTREISNWLNFSLIGIGLAYRAFYSVFFSDAGFFIYGLIGFGAFFLLGNLFYYGKVFAGGDAKLLMGFGVILPYSNFKELTFSGTVFVFCLLLAGGIWSLLYSFLIVKRDAGKFKREFFIKIKEFKIGIIGIVVLSIIFPYIFRFWLFLLFIFIPVIFVYVKALEKCMIKLINYRDLREGDWLESDVKIKGKVIRKSVHGLSLKDIEFLQKAKKNVLIRDGIPFAIVFLIALIMVFFLAVLKLQILQAFSLS